MDDALAELRRLAAQATTAAPYVRVAGEFLDRVANELAAHRKREDERQKELLFEEGAR
jgi:hypothetical protein